VQRDESRHTKHTRKLNAQLNKVEKVRFKDGMNETFNFANSDLNTLPPAINRVPIIGKLATSRMGYTSTEGFDLKTRMFSSVNSTIDNPKTSLKTRPFESITKFTDKDNSSIGSPIKSTNQSPKYAQQSSVASSMPPHVALYADLVENS
jgi:hypothetical protein